MRRRGLQTCFACPAGHSPVTDGAGHADPLQWAQRGITISQFTSKLWNSTVLRGGARGTLIPLGDQELAIRGFPNKFW